MVEAAFDFPCWFGFTYLTPQMLGHKHLVESGNRESYNEICSRLYGKGIKARAA